MTTELQETLMVNVDGAMRELREAAAELERASDGLKHELQSLRTDVNQLTLIINNEKENTK